MDSFWIVLFYLESLMGIFCHLDFTGCNFVLKFFFKAATRLNDAIKPLIIFRVYLVPLFQDKTNLVVWTCTTRAGASVQVPQ